MGLWSFLRGLWPWRKRPQSDKAPRPALQAEPEAAQPPEPVAPQPVEAPLPPPAAPVHEPPPPEPAPPEPEAVEPAAALPDQEAGEPAAGETEPLAPPIETAEQAEEPQAEEELEEDEDGGWEDEDVDDPDAPDPFISGAPSDEEADSADLAERRAAARIAALSGEQRIYLSMPAGPGSLAEALEQLAAEGLVTAEFVSEGEDPPHILYRPVDGGDGSVSAITSSQDQ